MVDNRPQAPAYSIGEEEIDLLAVFQTLWSGKWIVLTGGMVLALFAAAYAAFQPNIYRSEILLASASEQQSGNSLASQLGAAAGLIGLQVGAQESDQTTKALAILQSREFITSFIENHNILPTLFADKQLGPEQSSAIDSSRYDVETETWLVDEPSEEEAYLEFRDLLSVNESQSNGLVTVAIDWKNPGEARDWVKWIVDDLNNLLKQRDLQEATSAVSYLQEQLQTTQFVELQRALYQLIESQMRTIMLADVREEYVFSIVDPAFLPEEPVAPRRLLLVGLGGFFGLFLGCMVVFFREFLRTHDLERQS